MHAIEHAFADTNRLAGGVACVLRAIAAATTTISTITTGTGTSPVRVFVRD
ncbi:MAG TPA: hypothetical protein VFN09_05730 [Rhodanobacteraceae bacterium]|nr:hypothetical protein [Rhodanobacteraceae bacterium]